MIVTDNVEGLDEVLAKNIGDTLHKHYPGYLWLVHVDGRNGIANVLCGNLSGRWGFVVHLKDIDTEYKTIIRAGGEILERFRVKRGQMDEAQVANLPHDNIGNIILDKT